MDMQNHSDEDDGRERMKMAEGETIRKRSSARPEEIFGLECDGVVDIHLDLVERLLRTVR
jgi:hypothetical protein